MSFFERLTKRSTEARSLVCVGLDPDVKRHKVNEIAAYNRAIIEATAPYTACYKPNIAFLPSSDARTSTPTQTTAATNTTITPPREYVSSAA